LVPPVVHLAPQGTETGDQIALTLFEPRRDDVGAVGAITDNDVLGPEDFLELHEETKFVLGDVGTGTGQDGTAGETVEDDDLEQWEARGIELVGRPGESLSIGGSVGQTDA